MCCGWHGTAQGTVLWQPCSAIGKPAGIIQVSLQVREKIPENSIKLKTKVILFKYAAKLTTCFGSLVALLQVIIVSY